MVKFYKPQNKKTVLLIANYSGCPRTWKMAFALAKNNFKVSILEWDRTSSLSPFENNNNISVYRLKLKAGFGPRMGLKLLFWWYYIVVFLCANNYTVVQPQNLDNLIPVLIVSRIKKYKIVYDVADFFADSYGAFLCSCLKRNIAFLERLLVKSVNVAIIADEDRVKQMNLPQVPFLVIYNSPPDLYLEFKNNYKLSNNSNRCFTLFYAGCLEKDRGLDVIIKAVQSLAEIKLLVAGFGRLEKAIPSMIKNIPNIKFLNRIEYYEVLKLTYLSDCIIALYDPLISNNIFSSPNKLFEAMMCEKPIIVSSGTTMAAKVQKYQCGLEVKYGDVNELKETIKKLKTDHKLATKLGKNGRVSYLEKHNWSLMEEKITKLYQTLIQQC